MDTSALSLTIDQAELAGWSALSVTCDACGLRTDLPLWQLRQRTRLRALSEIAGHLSCRQCRRPASAVHAVRQAPSIGAGKGELNFLVEQWSADRQHVVETLASAGNVIVARAAWRAAVELRPSQWVTLRQGIRMITASDRDGDE